MSFVVGLSILAVVVPFAVGQFSGPEKDHAIDVFQTGVSNWLSEEQYVQVMNQLENDIYNEFPCTAMGPNLLAYILSAVSTNSSQIAELAAITANVTTAGLVNVPEMISIFSTALDEALCPYWDGEVANQLENDIYNEIPCTVMGTNLVTYLLSAISTNSTQTAELAAITANVTAAGLVNVPDMLLILVTALSEAVCPYWDGEFLANVTASKASGLPRNQVLQYAFHNFGQWMGQPGRLYKFWWSVVRGYVARTITVSIPLVDCLANFSLTTCLRLLTGQLTYWDVICPPFRNIFLVAYLANGIDCVECVKQEWLYFLDTGKCYKLSPQIENSYASANGYCTSGGGILVSIHSLTENQFIRNKVVNPYNNNTVAGFYIGMKKAPLTNAWIWEDGSATNFFRWAPGQPDGQAPPANIVRMVGTPANQLGLWDDIPDTATNSKKVICQRAPN